MTPKLSILIITIPSRADKLQRLLDILNPQLPADGSVEIIVKEELPSNDGGPTIGANRNAALADASGDYVSFIDDDDLVPKYYVERILKAIRPIESLEDYDNWNSTLDDLPSWEEMEGMTPDVVGIHGHYILGQNAPELFVHSIKYKEWKTVDGIHYRCPNHLNPVKRTIALQLPYPDKNYGEDVDYSMRLLPLLNTEVMVDDCIMYFYLKN
jgi:glycosyltransferase involved in cell wall biosynthesis